MLKRALVTFALTRTLNGVISVAQGTQLAFQPAGVGVVVYVIETLILPLGFLVVAWGLAKQTWRRLT